MWCACALLFIIHTDVAADTNYVADDDDDCKYNQKCVHTYIHTDVAVENDDIDR